MEPPDRGGPGAAAGPHPVDEIIAQVGVERPRLVDRWDATAVIESMGYTDARVREIGFPDMLALGSHVFDALGHRPVPPVAAADEPARLILDATHSVGASFVYAIPWLVIFLAGRRYPDLLRLPGDGAPLLTVALTLSLIASGGFVQALSRLAQFYFGVKQPRLATIVCGYLFRVGVMATVAIALTAIAVGRYVTHLPWPYLVIAADQLVVLSVLWLACAALTVRQQYWRVPLAFTAGAAVFALVRGAGGDTLAAELLGAAAALAAALAQVWSIFATRDAPAVPIPHLSVLLYRVRPYFCYGALYFGFICADRLIASVAQIVGGPALIPEVGLGMDLALITFLFGAAAVEYANIRFTRLIGARMIEPDAGGTHALTITAGQLHRRVMVVAVTGFVIMMLAVWGAAAWLLEDTPRSVWTTLAIADVAYLCFAIGVLNGLILISLNQPWAAAAAIAGGLIVHLAAGAIRTDLLNPYTAAGALLAGGVTVALLSTGAVYSRFRRADYALATF